MRWVCIAFLGTALTIAGAQQITKEHDITLDQGTSTTLQAETTEVQKIKDLRELDLDARTTDSTTEPTSEELTKTVTQNISTEDNNKDDSIQDENNNSNGESNQLGPRSSQSVEPDKEIDNDDISEQDRTNEQDETEDINEDTPTTTENGGEQSAETEKPDSNENNASPSLETASEETAGDPVVTEGGLVQGYSLHSDTGIRSYIDIPYGAFAGHFQAPTKPPHWEQVHTVSKHEKRCPQIDESGDYAGDSDCLTLSVFTPSNVQNAAVLFHLHDGDFSVGSADPNIYGPEYLVTKGVVLVLPNYRLGALGFLCMRNDIAPGNAGLKDLALALEWTKNNIANFGGDPSKIIVSGDGKAGALAGYLAVSNVSRSHVSGVITESGSMLAHWSIDRDPNATASLLRDKINTEITNQMDLQTLVSSAKNITFRPCVETGVNTFLKETPWHILQNEAIDIPFVIGSANHAGVQEAVAHTSESLKELEENFGFFLPNDLKISEGKETEVAEKIKKQYFGENAIGSENLVGVSLLYTDAYYLGPAIRTSRALVGAGAKVYFFEFSFVGELNRMLESLSARVPVQGAARGDLISYTFTQDGGVHSEGTAEERMVNIITDLWISFMQTGKPSANDIAWNSLDHVAEAEEEYLVMDREMVLKKGVHVDRLALWTEIYNTYFIERNLAINISSSVYLVMIATLFMFFYNRDDDYI